MHKGIIGNAIIGNAALLACAFLLAAGVGTDVSADTGAKDTATTAPWRTLFDGKLLDSFRGWRSDGMPEGWHVVDGALAKEGHGDALLTGEQFGNLEVRA